jgi:hypothetical protein
MRDEYNIIITQLLNPKIDYSRSGHLFLDVLPAAAAAAEVWNFDDLKSQSICVLICHGFFVKRCLTAAPFLVVLAWPG